MLPEVTRERMYLETMERVLAGVNKTIIDQPNGQQGVVPFLPLGQANGYVPPPPQTSTRPAPGRFRKLSSRESADEQVVSGRRRPCDPDWRLVIGTASVFTVHQTQQALVLRSVSPWATAPW